MSELQQGKKDYVEGGVQNTGELLSLSWASVMIRLRIVKVSKTP